MLYDAMAGLYLTRTRAYNPRTGRFLQRDKLDESGRNGIYRGFPFGSDAIGSNLYAWCRNNPTSMVDPSGHWGFRNLIGGFVRAAKSCVSNFRRIVSYVQRAVSGAVGYVRSTARRYRRTVARAATTIRQAVRRVVTTVRKVIKVQAWVNKISSTRWKEGISVSGRSPVIDTRTSPPAYHDNSGNIVGVWKPRNNLRWGTDCAGAQIGAVGLASYGVGALVGGLPGAAIGGVGNRASLVAGVINDSIQLRDQHNYVEFAIKTGASLIAFQVPGLDPWVGGVLTGLDASGCAMEK